MADVRAEKNISPVKLELLVTVVPRSKAMFYVDYIQSLGANMQLSVQAQGTASQEILGYLGLEDSNKTVILSAVREESLGDIMDGLEEKFHTIKNGKGISVALPFSSVIGKLVFGFLSDDRRMVSGAVK